MVGVLASLLGKVKTCSKVIKTGVFNTSLCLVFLLLGIEIRALCMLGSALLPSSVFTQLLYRFFKHFTFQPLYLWTPTPKWFYTCRKEGKNVIQCVLQPHFGCYAFPFNNHLERKVLSWSCIWGNPGLGRSTVWRVTLHTSGLTGIWTHFWANTSLATSGKAKCILFVIMYIMYTYCIQMRKHWETNKMKMK